ncbi:Csu type fimbrial protein [Nostoc sp.]|uniref:Csu type fimbrial protein n=1 Tax=Nostoc sp. TaxID=1180 RepID=UPI002FFA21A5
MMLRRLALASVLLIASSAAPAMAATATTNLGTTATVVANCTISTTPVAFGSYDPVTTNAGTALTGTGTVTTTCTDGSVASITLDQGSNPATGSTDAAPARQLIDGSTNTLLYSLYSDTGRTVVWGNTSGAGGTDVTVTGSGVAQASTVYGSIAGAQNKPAGAYTDTVQATVTF